jgi:hypothetical protein
MIKQILLTGAMSIVLIACNNELKQKSVADSTPKMTQYQKDQRNKDITLKCISAYAAKDSDYILAQNADNVVNIYEGRPPIHGIDSARIILREAFKMIKDYKPSNQVVLADSNYVFVFQYIDISNNKNDDTWNAKQVEIFKFNDEGKIILHNGVGETLAPNDVRFPL